MKPNRKSFRVGRFGVKKKDKKDQRYVEQYSVSSNDGNLELIF